MPLPTPDDYSFGKTAAELYEELSVDRSGVVDKARELAQISLPVLFPPEGFRPGDNLPPPNQSINARCIVNLASRIMLTALPPGKPILKYNILEYKLREEIDADPELYSETTMALSLLELAHRNRIEATAVRTAYVQFASQLILAGNVLWKHLDINNPSVHRCDSYVVKRNATGQQQKIALKTYTSFADMDPITREFIRNVMVAQGSPDLERDGVDIYSCLKLHHVSKKRKVWLYWEEYEGNVIPDTEAMTEYTKPPMYAEWMVPEYGSDWGTSYCQLYEGDMYIVENSNSSLNDMSEIAALTWLFLRPGGVTSKRVLDNAKNTKLMYGDAGEITAFRLDKINDGAFVDGHAGKAERRLGAAFLMVSSFQRNAERVTAEEWRMLAGELDQAMGGLYSQLAQGGGRAIIMRFLDLHEDEEKDLPAMPEEVVRVGVITGIDALGLSEEQQNLEQALRVLSQFLGPEGLVKMLNGMDIVRRVFAGYSVRSAGLLKKDEDQAAEEQQAMQQQAQMTMLDKGTGPLAAAAGEGGNQLLEALLSGAQQAPQQPQQ